MSIEVRKLSSIEGVGYSKAKTIISSLDKKPSECSRHELMEVEGIGDTLAGRITEKFSG